MNLSCNYSFRDLYAAAFNREPESLELEVLYALPQSVRNEEVKKWVNLAGWHYEDVVGSDGVVYTAFSPKLAE